MRHRLTAMTLLVLLAAGCGREAKLSSRATALGAASMTSGSNLPPRVDVTTPASPQTGVVLLGYTARDEQSDPVTVAVDVSRDGGGTWRTASRAAGVGDGTSGLATSPAGFGYAFAWDAPADLGAARATCRLRVTPSDALAAGVATVTSDFAVDLAPAGPTPAPTPTPTRTPTPTPTATSVGAPSISRLRPALGARQATVWIEGAGFSATASQNVVRFDGLATPVVLARPDELVVSVPAGARTGSVAVTVESAGVPASNQATFQVLDDPRVTRVAPSTALVGDRIAIEGTNFDDTRANGVVVRFAGGVSAVVTAPSSSRFEVVVPAGAQTGSLWVVTHGAVSNGMPFSVGSAPAPTPAPGTDDHGDDAGHATAIAAGQTVPGRADRAGDPDWFAVPLRAGRTYVARTSALQGGMDTVLAAYDPSVAFLAENDDEPSTLTVLSSRVDLAPTRDGIYYLKVRHYLSYATSGSYALTVTDVTAAPAPAPAPTPNLAPSVLGLTTPQGTQAGAVAVSFTLVDAEADRVDLRVEYRLGSGAWLPATRDATSDPTTGLTASPGGATYRFVWRSALDTGAYAGTAALRLTPTDARGAAGAPVATQAFVLSNTATSTTSTTGTYATPFVLSVTTSTTGTYATPVVLSVGTPQGTQRGPVAIPCVVTDADVEAVDLTLEYMLTATARLAAVHPARHVGPRAGRARERGRHERAARVGQPRRPGADAGDGRDRARDRARPARARERAARDWLVRGGRPVACAVDAAAPPSERRQRPWRPARSCRASTARSRP